MPAYAVSEEVEEVAHDLKKIRVTGFGNDYALFKKALPVMVEEREFYRSRGFEPVAGCGKLAGEVYIAKKIHCESLHRLDKFRVVFQVLDCKIRIIEVFFKGDKETEDKAKIRRYCAAD